MKKIIYIANARIPTERAHGIQIMKMCEAFAASGAETELVLPHRSNRLKDDPFDYYRTPKNFKIKKLPCIDFTGYSNGKVAFGIEILTFLFAAKIYLLFQKYDILYTRESLVGIFFKDYALELHTLPAIISKFHLFLWRRARFLIVITSGIAERIVSCGVPKGKVLVASDGVDLRLFSSLDFSGISRERLGLPHGKPLALYAGHLYGWKGVFTLAEAARMSPGINFAFLGGAPDHVKEFRDKYGGVPNIFILGSKSHSDVPAYLHLADVLVLPNSAEKEISRLYTSPLKLFEYMAAGRPIVAADLPSVREVMNESSCYFFIPDDYNNLSIVINKALNDLHFEKKVIKNLQDIKKYTWNKRAIAIVKFIG